jgi:hypothetical protein
VLCDNGPVRETLPAFGADDIRLTGWECGEADGSDGQAGPGDLVVQFRCPCGCGVTGSLVLPPGARIANESPAGLVVSGVSFCGPFAQPPRREP